MTFAEELTAAMTARSINSADLARRTGLQDDGISKLKRGLRLPTFATADRLAEALEWPDLLHVLERERRRRCVVCRRKFVTLAKFPGRVRFCSQTCQITDHQRRRTGRKHDVTRARLDSALSAVAAFCGGCAGWERVCRDADCQLRGLSPLPFVPLHTIRSKAA